MARRAVWLLGLIVPTLANAQEGASTNADKAGEVKKPETRRLCDEDWYGGFWTIAVDKKMYDGNAKNLKDYDPQHPNDPWQVVSDRYFGLKDCCGDVYLQKFIGRFYDRKEAERFLRKVYSNSDFARHLNPRYPPTVIRPDALLVSEKYTCKLEKQNDRLRNANWVVEMDGRLFASAESRCKEGRKKKTITVVDCGGSKTIVTDTLEAPCEVGIRSCLYPMPDDAFLMDHDYTEGGEGTSVAVRAYDLRQKRQVFSANETNDGDADTVLMSIQDVDGDGVPEIVHRVAGTDELVSKLKWRNRRFVKAK